MNAIDLLTLNLEEVRRRSIKLWNAVPPAQLGWKPDPDAMTCIELVRHVLEGEYLYMAMLKNGGTLASEDTPWTGRPFMAVTGEIVFAAPWRQEFLTLVGSYTTDELESLQVDRSEKGYVRSAGDFILRMAYHESVHAGQLLGYLRTMSAPRPDIWD